MTSIDLNSNDAIMAEIQAVKDRLSKFETEDLDEFSEQEQEEPQEEPQEPLKVTLPIRSNTMGGSLNNDPMTSRWLNLINQ